MTSAKKITYQATEDPKSVLAQFRNGYNPRIAVTVDMIATGTDVKPLECLLFMRDVKSKNYFEQMKGRGTRTLDADDLKKVTPSATTAKTHYVIVDAIGVTKSLKTASQPLITKPTVSLKDLATGVMMGARDEDTVSSLAGRLARLDKQLDDKERDRIKTAASGLLLADIVRRLVDAIDPDKVEEPINLLDQASRPMSSARRPVIGLWDRQQMSSLARSSIFSTVSDARRSRQSTTIIWTSFSTRAGAVMRKKTPRPWSRTSLRI
jgi:type I restriction enzyme R subunit